MNNRLILISYLCVFLTTQVAGAAPAGSTAIRISADNVVVDQKTLSSTYTGNVKLEQGDMHLQADQLKVFTENKRLQRLEASGNPATLRNVGKNGTAVQGFASKIDYRATSGEVLFTGNAKLIQADNTIESQTIRYNLDQETLEAGSPQSGDRVDVILLPAEK